MWLLLVSTWMFLGLEREVFRGGKGGGERDG